MWKCPSCKREFKNRNQSHSCNSVTLESHFKNKEYAKELFTYLTRELETKVGPLKIETPACCIHLVSNFTFGAVWALKDRIRVDFRTDFVIESKRIWKVIKLSANRYLYYFEIKEKEDVDAELLGWIKKAYYLNTENQS